MQVLVQVGEKLNYNMKDREYKLRLMKSCLSKGDFVSIYRTRSSGFIVETEDISTLNGYTIGDTTGVSLNDIEPINTDVKIMMFEGQDLIYFSIIPINLRLYSSISLGKQEYNCKIESINREYIRNNSFKSAKEVKEKGDLYFDENAEYRVLKMPMPFNKIHNLNVEEGEIFNKPIRFSDSKYIFKGLDSPIPFYGLDKVSDEYFLTFTVDGYSTSIIVNTVFKECFEKCDTFKLLKLDE